jgi:hypothetical protein
MEKEGIIRQTNDRDIKQIPRHLVHKRTIPTYQSPLVAEVIINFCGLRGVVWSAQRVPMVINLEFIRQEVIFFIEVALHLPSQS